MSPEDILIEKCIEGNPRYQKELYDRYAKKMFNLCLRYTKNREEAEDIYQEGFINVFKNLVNFRRESALETWIRSIMINASLKYLRKPENKINRVDVDDVYDIPYEPFERVLDKMNQEELIKCINRLPDDYRIVLNMFVFEGFSHKEIAEQLGIAENTSKSKVLRARKYLQEILLKLERLPQP